MDKSSYAIASIAMIQMVWVVFSLVSLHRSIPNAVFKKYPRSVRILCALPFPSGWRTKIADEDIYFFKKCRKIFLSMHLFLLLTFMVQLLLTLFFLCGQLDLINVQKTEIGDVGIIGQLLLELCY